MGLQGTVLGFLYGMQFDKKRPTECYSAVETQSSGFLTLGSLLEDLVNPASWAGIALTGNILTTIYSTVLNKCKVYQFAVTITKQITEGVSGLAARVGGGLISEIPDAFVSYSNARTDFERGTPLGIVFSLALDYHL